MTELALNEETLLVNVETGEQMRATVDNAAEVLDAARRMKRRLDEVIGAATSYLLAESQTRGTKTLPFTHGKVELSGGLTVDYDPVDLVEALREAGCPEERIAEAVVEEISYRVNRSVLRQLAGANPDYRAAVELAERTVERPWRAAVKA
jgi:hypothetical protein